MHYFYLHGFASSPKSAKGMDLQHRFRAKGMDLIIPDLNLPDFSTLTLTRQIEQVSALLPSSPVTLIGSSLGGLVAAWIAEKQPQVKQLILLAPAFEFLTNWLSLQPEDMLSRWQAEGSLAVEHYGTKTTQFLNYGFYTDARKYNDGDLQRSLPTLILHGINDEVIAIESSGKYAATRPWVNLIPLDSDHSLGNVYPEIWDAIQTCLS